jgi:hypothetical protein
MCFKEEVNETPNYTLRRKNESNQTQETQEESNGNLHTIARRRPDSASSGNGGGSGSSGSLSDFGVVGRGCVSALTRNDGRGGLGIARPGGVPTV